MALPRADLNHAGIRPAALRLPGETFLSRIMRLERPDSGRDALNRAAYFLSASIGSLTDGASNRRFPSGNVMFLPTARFPRSLAW